MKQKGNSEKLGR